MSTSFTHTTRTSAPAATVSVLVAASAHEFSVPVVRETPSPRAEPASVAGLW